MRSGLFAFFENPHHDMPRALREQIALVKEAETLGFDEVWVSEHHFNDYSVSGPITELMAYMCAMSERIRIGSAAVLMPYRSPVMVAEAIAALDILTDGRVMLGMAKGAFPMDDRHFASDLQRNREALYEAAIIVKKLLKGEAVSFHGNYFDFDEATALPAPLNPIPGYIATFGSEESIRFAAEHGFDLMMGQTSELASVEQSVRLYERYAGRRPDMVVLRLCSIKETDETAREKALTSAHGFSARMKRVKSGGIGKSSGAFEPTRDALFEAHPMAECGIVGSPKTCEALIQAHRNAGVTSIVLRPIGQTLQANKRILAAYKSLC